MWQGSVVSSEKNKDLCGRGHGCHMIITTLSWDICLFVGLISQGNRNFAAQNMDLCQECAKDINHVFVFTRSYSIDNGIVQIHNDNDDHHHCNADVDDNEVSPI